MNCVNPCGNTYYGDATTLTCLACVSPCVNCVTTFSTCTSCITSKFLDGNICRDACLSGYYADSSKNCIKCPT
jgi:hypothetical protein